MKNHLIKFSSKPEYSGLISFTDNGKQFSRYLEEIFPNLPKNTRKAIASDWRQYCQFCTENSLKPIHEDSEVMGKTILSFVDYQATHLKHNTISRRITSLKTIFQAMNVNNPLVTDIIVKKAVRLKINNISRPAGQAKPLMWETINRHISSLDLNDLLSLRTAIILCLAFDTMCRASELAQIKFEHITRRANGHGSVLIEKSKTDKTAIGSYRFVNSSTLRLIDLWSEKIGIKRGFILRPINGKSRMIYATSQKNGAKAINYSTILNAFKSVGYNDGFTAHSTRVGSALEQIQANISSQKIQLAGGWKSPHMIAYYGRQLDDQTSGSAELAYVKKNLND